MNAGNGAFLSCNAQRSGETNIELSIKLYVWNIFLSANKLGLWFLSDAFRLPGQIKRFLPALRFDLEATSDLRMILVRNVKRPGWRGSDLNAGHSWGVGGFQEKIDGATQGEDVMREE